jgi:hypothetical protein
MSTVPRRGDVQSQGIGQQVTCGPDVGTGDQPRLRQDGTIAESWETEDPIVDTEVATGIVGTGLDRIPTIVVTVGELVGLIDGYRDEEGKPPLCSAELGDAATAAILDSELPPPNQT